MHAADPELYPFVIVGFIIAFALAFGIGANDVANSFGTSVGSKVLTLRQACMLASVFEILGAILIGGKVSETIREGIINPVLFRGQEKEYCLGLVASLAGCCLWMLLATFFKLPVSGTHSIVGSTMGFALVSRGSSAIQWKHFVKIVASWFISPILSGLISVVVFLLIRRFILSVPASLPSANRFEQSQLIEDSFRRGLRWLPFFYSVTILINVFSVLLSGPSLFYFNRIPLWSKLLIVLLVGLCTAIIVRLCVVPKLKKKIEGLKHKEEPADEHKSAQQSTGINAPAEVVVKFGSEADNNKLLKGASNVELPNAKAENERTRLFTIECAKDSVDVGVQVDYITLLSDRSLQLRQLWCLGPQAITICNDPMVPIRKNYAESERAYTSHTYGGSERRRRIGRMPYLRGISDQKRPIDAASSTIESSDRMLGQCRMSSDLGDARTVLLQRSWPEGLDLVSAVDTFPHISDRTLVPAFRCPSVEDVESSDSEPDEIELRVNYEDQKHKVVKRDDDVTDSAEIGKLFSFLQILTAIFGSFAHGGNDVSNAIGPLISLWLVFAEGTVQSSKSPIWVLFYGGVGIILGLWIWGRRVIKTIGEDLTKITPSVGFVIEISSAFTVLFASNLSIPVSTTHCKVGSVVFTGRVRSKKSVDWSLFGNIIIAWLVTVPVTGIISAALTALFRNAVLSH